MDDVRFDNLNEFLADLDHFVDITIPDEITAFQKKIVILVLRKVVIRTPVLTGRLRGNWQVTINFEPHSRLDIEDKTGGATISKGVAASEEIKPFSLVFIVNNLPYAEPIESGYSIKAPEGMVAVTVEEIEAAYP